MIGRAPITAPSSGTASHSATQSASGHGSRHAGDAGQRVGDRAGEGGDDDRAAGVTEGAVVDGVGDVRSRPPAARRRGSGVPALSASVAPCRRKNTVRTNTARKDRPRVAAERMASAGVPPRRRSGTPADETLGALAEIGLGGGFGEAAVGLDLLRELGRSSPGGCRSARRRRRRGRTSPRRRARGRRWRRRRRRVRAGCGGRPSRRQGIRGQPSTTRSAPTPSTRSALASTREGEQRRGDDEDGDDDRAAADAQAPRHRLADHLRQGIDTAAGVGHVGTVPACPTRQHPSRSTSTGDRSPPWPAPSPGWSCSSGLFRSVPRTLAALGVGRRADPGSRPAGLAVVATAWAALAAWRSAIVLAGFVAAVTLIGRGARAAGGAPGARPRRRPARPCSRT